MHENLLSLEEDTPDHVAQAPGKNASGPKVHMATFGCQMNKLDSEIVAGDLLHRGYSFVDSESDADVIIYNTCSVRHKAENRLYGRLSALEQYSKKQGRELVVGVMGCVAQQEKDTIFERSKLVKFVVGTDEFNNVGGILDMIRRGEQENVLAVQLDRKFGYERNPAARPTPWHGFVSAMRGCDKYCTYCVVPFTRGREVSRPQNEVIDEVKALVQDGVKEITILGQRIDTYGRDLKNGSTLAGLLTQLAALDGLERIKFITAHPNFMERELFELLVSSPKFSRYIHMPVQSGSNEVLTAMNRGYTREQYLDIIRMAREVGEFNFTSDFIVGFYNETDADFEQTLSLMREVRFGGAFIFKYSVRPGTYAEKMGDPIPDAVKKDRNQALLQLQEEISREAQRAQVGRRARVLCEGPSKSDADKMVGRDEFNRIVVFEAGRDCTGRFVDVEITDCTPLTLFARPV